MQSVQQLRNYFAQIGLHMQYENLQHQYRVLDQKQEVNMAIHALDNLKSICFPYFMKWQPQHCHKMLGSDQCSWTVIRTVTL